MTVPARSAAKPGQVWPDATQAALANPSGARFYRCALQINPYAYLVVNKKTTSFKDEAAYNRAIVEACIAANVEAIAVTDHYRVRSGDSLRLAARRAGLYVFGGFEASTKDGIHVLCLFDADVATEALERFLGDCGIHDETQVSPLGKYDFIELLREARRWGAVCVAAHVASSGGLLKTLRGQARMSAWRSEDLLACSLPGPAKEAPEDIRAILENTNPEHRREQPVAILNAQDVDDPADIAQAGVTTWIKMSKVSVEGLRQAFLDPGSRIRLNTDPVPEAHAEFVAVSWQGGFLDGVGLHFNENLNVLIGGRGTGKSTLVESLRYVLGLDALGDEAKRAHDGIIRHVLRSGTKISLLVRSHRPKAREYLIERTVPNPPIVRSDSGEVLALTPLDVVARAEIYGQHEISELTRSREKLTRLLERFAERDAGVLRRKTELKRELERSRTQILEFQRDLQQTEERLSSLPRLEETLKVFQEAGLEDRLKEQSLLVREERVVSALPERVRPFRDALDLLQRELPVDRTFLSAKALESLPGAPILSRADAVLRVLTKDLEDVVRGLEAALKKAEVGLDEVRLSWEERKRAVDVAYERILRDLQRSKIDGESFIRLRRQIEELRPLRDGQASRQKSLRDAQDRRRSLLVEWEDLKADEFRRLERAAADVNRRLSNRVRVTPAYAGNREPLVQLLREKIPGRLAELTDALSRREVLSLTEFVEAARDGRDTLAQKFGVPPAQADRLAQAPADALMQIEELDLPATTRIELNVAPDSQRATWQTLEQLSTGQKATAVLLLLLLESDAPLVVDQPEDDLDNRFITEGVVPKMREEKRRRQFIMATHNANIPVLGDAELIVALSAAGEASEGRANIAPEHMGSIDSTPVRELVEEILEGGKEAFEIRRRKYGF